MACNCSKPKPGPNGNQTPPATPTPPTKSLIASSGGSGGGAFIYVAPDGSKTPFGDLLGARAAVARTGGSISIA